MLCCPPHPDSFYASTMSSALASDALANAGGGYEKGAAVVPRLGCGADGWDARVPACARPGGAAGFQATWTFAMYGKGASLLRMLQLYLDGTAAWAFPHRSAPTPLFVGLRAYLNAHYAASARTADLWAALEGAIGAPWMGTWVDTPGFPLVRVTEGAGGALTATQAPYNRTAPPGTRWWVPLSYTTRDDPRRARYVAFSSASVAVPHALRDAADWVKFNVNGS
eukprot:gene10446-4871_t